RITRKLDYDNYVCGALFPQHIRESFFAIRAVNAEIAGIKDTIRTNPATGKIRIQWWRDRINAMYTPEAGAPQETVLLRGLQRAIQEHNLTRRWFDRLIDAREDDLETHFIDELRELEVYSEKTASSLMYLALECLGVREDIADRCASHAGATIGLATFLRATPHHSKKEHVYLPEGVLLKHNLQPDDVFAGLEDPVNGAKLAPAVFDVACRAMEHLHAARALQKELPAAARPAFLSVVPSALYLADLEKVNFNVYAPELQQRQALQLHWQVLKRHFLGSF
ncbi:TPA: hypothetical protein N0F65_005201, partial [Lagenidium giganteum]